MRICIISDTHLGAKNNCAVFNEFFLKFYEEIFFPYLEENKISTIIHGGDLGEYRKNVNLSILNQWNERVFERLKPYDCYFISGNHDLFYRHDSSISLQTSLLLDKKFGFHLISSSPETIELDSRKIDLIPWITSSNATSIEEFIKQSSSPLLISHLEISGALMTPGIYCSESQLSLSLLEKYHKVISGHFHLRSSVGNVTYIGNPYEIIWSDCGYKKGFVILDTEDLSLEYINNPFTMFEKIYFDSIKPKEIDFSIYERKHIKLFITPQSKKSKVEAFISILEKLNPLSLIIQEKDIDKSSLSSLETEGMNPQETFHYIEHYINELFQNQSLKLNKDKLLSIMNSIYQESMKQET